MKKNIKNKTILVTGSSGFIGYHLVKKLLENNIKVIGIDNMNDYYDIKLKEHRLNLLKNNNYTFINGNIGDKDLVNNTFKKYKPNIVINLAAQAGVRYSSINPDSYIESNIIGFYNILNACKDYNIKHLIYASSSSVYGNSKDIPYNIETKTDNPISLYGATKKTDEILAYSYSYTYNLKTTGLRFFTVYGPLGRPDMSYYKFTDKLLNKELIELYNNGEYIRDFTYIDDVIKTILKIIESDNNKNYSIYNVGNSNPVKVIDFVDILINNLIEEKLLPKSFNKEKYIKLTPKTKEDVDITYADTSKLKRDFNIEINTDLKTGLKEFIKWYKEYRNN